MKILTILNKEKELLLLGASPSKELQAALKLENRLNSLLNQGVDEKRDFNATLNEFSKISLEFNKLLSGNW